MGQMYDEGELIKSAAHELGHRVLYYPLSDSIRATTHSTVHSHLLQMQLLLTVGHEGGQTFKIQHELSLLTEKATIPCI